MTTNQSDEAADGAEETPETGVAEEAVPDEAGPADTGADEADAGEISGVAADIAQRFAELVGAESWSAAHGLAKVKVGKDDWASAARTVFDNGMPFLSYLSAVDWASEVAVGEPLDTVDERYEVVLRMSSLSSDDSVTLTTDLPKHDPSIESLVAVLPGADWHEREAAEMFGIEFVGHPNPKKLYLPDAFEGYPLRKSYALLSREVKPWPGMVDVEGMPEDASGPSTENPEAPADAATDGAEAEGGEE